MGVDHRKIFFGYIKDQFAPRLRSVGFAGSGFHFRRITGEVINTVSIQRSQSGRECAVNLGLHLTFLPMCWKEELPDLKSIKETDCEFRTRLTPKGKEDFWWKYGGLLDPPSRSIQHLIQTYFEWGEGQFDKYKSAADVASMFSLDDVRKGNWMGEFGGKTAPRAALAMARVHAHLGRMDLARQYAQIGLDRIGRGIALKPILERLVHGS